MLGMVKLQASVLVSSVVSPSLMTRVDVSSDDESGTSASDDGQIVLETDR